MQSRVKVTTLLLAPANLANYRSDHFLPLGHDSDSLDHTTSNLMKWVTAPPFDAVPAEGFEKVNDPPGVWSHRASYALHLDRFPDSLSALASSRTVKPIIADENRMWHFHR